jgi:hypothetical protein
MQYQREDQILADQREHERNQWDHEREMHRETEENKEKLQDIDHAFQEAMQERHWEAAAILEKKKYEAAVELSKYNNQQLQGMLDQFSRYMVDGLKGSLDNIPKEFANLGQTLVKQINTQKALPEGGSNKIKRIAGAHHCRLSTGPDNVVYAYETGNGKIYHQCILAYGAQKRSVLGWQIINHDVLNQSGCPLYRSGTVTRQFLAGILPGKTTTGHCELKGGTFVQITGLPK